MTVLLTIFRNILIGMTWRCRSDRKEIAIERPMIHINLLEIDSATIYWKLESHGHLRHGTYHHHPQHTRTIFPNYLIQQFSRIKGEIIRKTFVTGVTLLLIQSSEKQNMTCFILVRNKSQLMQSLFRKRSWLFYIPLLIAGLVQEPGWYSTYHGKTRSATVSPGELKQINQIWVFDSISHLVP